MSDSTAKPQVLEFPAGDDELPTDTDVLESIIITEKP